MEIGTRGAVIHNREGIRQGIVRLDQDEVGATIGEVYTEDAEKRGAVRFLPLTSLAEEAVIHARPDRDQIGYVRLDRQDEDHLAGRVYQARSGAKDVVVATVQANGRNPEVAEFWTVSTGGEEQKLGWLQAEDVSLEELILLGGGAAYLILMNGE